MQRPDLNQIFVTNQTSGFINQVEDEFECQLTKSKGQFCHNRRRLTSAKIELQKKGKSRLNNNTFLDVNLSSLDIKNDTVHSGGWRSFAN